MKTVFYNFSRGVDAVTDRRMVPDGYAIVMDNVDIRSGFPRPFKAPSFYQSASPNTTRIWEFRGKWYTSDLYRTYAAEALPTQERIYYAEEGSGHSIPQKIVNDVQAQLGTLVPESGPILSTASNVTPRGLTLTAGATGNLSTNTQYGYRVAAKTPLGVLAACQEVLITLTGTTTTTTTGGGIFGSGTTTTSTSATGSVTLSWGAVPGAIGYVIFGRTPGSEQVIDEVGPITSYLDDGSKTPAGPYATTYDVTAPYTYVYTYVRTVGSMEDESGPSPLSTILNSGAGRVVRRQPQYDGYLTDATSITSGITTTASPYSSTITGTYVTGVNTYLTVQDDPVGPWYNGDGLQIIDSANGTNYSVNGANMEFAFPDALSTPSAPVPGTETGSSGLAAGTYIWKLAAINGTLTVTAGDPALTAASTSSTSKTLGSPASVPLTWTPVLNATGYRLYRSSDAGSTWDQVATISQSLSSYTDDGTNEATGVTPPTTDSTGTRILVLVNNDLSAVLPDPIPSTLTAYLGKTIVNLSPAQVVADGDAVYLSGANQSALNKTQGAELYQADVVVSSNINTSNPGTSSFDGYTVQSGAVLLLTGQATASQNGLWEFNGSGSALTRPIQYSTGEVITGASLGSVYVNHGTVYADTLLHITTAGSITIGTTGTAWATTTTTTAFLVPQYTADDDTPTQMQWITGNNYFTKWRIYRSGDSAEFLLVDEVDITVDTYTDTVPVTALGVALPTSYTQDGVSVTYAVPPTTLQYLELFNGMLFGVDGNTVRWTPIGVPDAWPDAFSLTFAYPPLGLASFASGLIVLCPDAIYRLDGFTPTTLNLQKTFAEDGCIAPRSIQKTSLGLLYLAKRGVMLFDGNVARCLTEAKLPYKFLIQPSTYTEPYSKQSFWWYTTDHTAAYAQLCWDDNSPIYSANTIAYTIANDTPQDGTIYTIRSFVFRNKYFLFYSNDGVDFDANTVVCIDLGADTFPITTLGAKLVDAHVSSLDEAYVLLPYAPPDMSVSISSPVDGSLALSTGAVTYTASAITGTSGGTYDGPYTYSWSFDDGGTGSAASVSHTWSTSGIHKGTITATNTTTSQTASAFVDVKVVSQWITETPTIPAFNGRRYGPRAIPLGSSTSLIIGSDDANTIGNQCYIYDNTAHTIIATGSIPATRTKQDLFGACKMSDGKILLTGGATSVGLSGTKTSFVYDPSTGIWTQVADRTYVVSASNPFSDVLMSNGKVFSPSTDSGTSGNKFEAYDPTAGTWTTLPNRTDSATIQLPSVCVMANGKIFHGPGTGTSTTACQAYDPVANTWAALTPSPYSNAVTAALTGGKLLSVKLDSGSNAACSLYDPTANSWSTVATLPTPTATDFYVLPLPDGTAFASSMSEGAKAVYRYDPVANIWTTYPTTNYSHAGSSINYLNGTIAIFGAKDTISPNGETKVEYLA